MENKYVAVWAVLLMVMGCAAVEPARVENNRYFNPAYQFSLGVPSGWEVSHEIPKTLRKGMSFVSGQKFKATFSDLDNRRFILVSAERTELDWVSLKMHSDKFIASLGDFYAGQKRKFLKQSGWHDYRYEIYQDRIERCQDHCIVTQVDFHVQDLMATGHNIIYKSNYGIVYTVSVILIAREEQHAAGLEAFKTVVDSFRQQ